MKNMDKGLTAEKIGADKFWGIWGIFGLTISTHFGTKSFDHVFNYSTIISTKN